MANRDLAGPYDYTTLVKGMSGFSTSSESSNSPKSALEKLQDIQIFREMQRMSNINLFETRFAQNWPI